MDSKRRRCCCLPVRGGWRQGDCW